MNYFESNKVIDNNIKMSKFKSKLSIEKRLEVSKKLLAQYHDRLPVFIEKKDKTDPDIEREKFLVPNNYTIGLLMKEIRKHITKLQPGETIMLFCNNKMLRTSDTIMSVYTQNKDRDNLLYLVYTVESSFG